MSAPDSQLWQIIRAREKSLAACERLFSGQLRESQQQRVELEADIVRHRALLAEAGIEAGRAAAAHRQELAAKELALKSLEAEAAAHQRWKQLCREAEQQLAGLKKSLTAEAAAKAVAANLLQQTERRAADTASERDREFTAKELALKKLRAEQEAHERWEKLCHEAEAQVAELKTAVAAEAEAKAVAAKALQQIEQRARRAESDRDRELAAKGESQKALQAEAAARSAAVQLLQQTEQRVATVAGERDREFAARASWEKLCHEAEAQVAALKEHVAAEAAAKSAAAQLLQQTEQRVAAVADERDRELAAHQRWEKLCHEAEQQVARLKEQLAAEMRTTAETNRRLQETAEHVHAVERERQDEIAAKEKLAQLLQAEAAAHHRWAALCQAAEDQLQALRQQVAAEAAEKIKTAGLLGETERRMLGAEADRDRERTAKEQALGLVQDELAAHERWEKLCREAEAQVAALREHLAGAERRATAADDVAAQQRTEREAAQARLQHELETARLAAKEKLAAAETEITAATAAHERIRAALATESAAHHQAMELYQAAEARATALAAELHTLRASWEQERLAWKEHTAAQTVAVAATYSEWAQIQRESETQRERANRALAEGDRRFLELSAEVQTQQERSRRAETTVADQIRQIDRLNTESARAASDLNTFFSRLVEGDLARDLAEEDRRLSAFRHTLGGRWLAFRNATARAIRRLYCFAKEKAFVRPLPESGPRIAQINTHDLIGGAERTSYDLHVQYRQRGLKPTLTVGGKHGQDEDVIPIPFKPYDWESAPVWRDRWGLTEVLYPTPVLGCFQWPYLRESHVVHIHNMHGHYWNSATLLALGMQHPVVLTLHDEYTMTGDCCYTYDCNRWQQSCGNCPQIGKDRIARYTLGERDLTRLNVHLKRSWFRAPRAYPMVIVTPSRWLSARARQSPNLRHLPVITINNGIDLDFWCPQPQAGARQRLELPARKTIGLVVATHLSDIRKGFDCVLQSIRALPAGHNLLFVVVGKITDELRSAIAGLPVIAAGYVKDKTRMRDLFSAADFTFSMSRMDNLPYMCVESLACGRPVFGSDVGGIPEIVNEPELGWLTPMPFDHQAIARQLLAIDREPAAERQRRFAACRRSALARFSLHSMVERYLRLYQEMLDAAREGRTLEVERIAQLSPNRS